MPKPPESYRLGAAGLAWWSWAWRLPQACGWSDGDLYALVRRASLEDDLAALEQLDGFDFSAVFVEDVARAVEAMVGKLRALAGGRLTIVREMRELDGKLGLTPKGLADLRWKIVDDVPVAAGPAPAGVASLSERRSRIRDAS